MSISIKGPSIRSLTQTDDKAAYQSADVHRRRVNLVIALTLKSLRSESLLEKWNHNHDIRGYMEEEGGGGGGGRDPLIKL